MIEDIKDKMVSSIFLYAIIFFQLISSVLIYNSYYFILKLIISIIIFALYYIIPNLRKYVGEADIIFICMQIISMTINSFYIFWWSYLIFSLIYGMILYIIKKDSYVPMFPSFAFGEFISIIGRIL